MVSAAEMLRIFIMSSFLLTLCAASVHQADPVAKVTDGDLQLLSSGTKVVWLNVGDSKSVQVKEAPQFL